MKKKDLVVNIGLLLGSIIFVIIALEILLGVYSPPTADDVWKFITPNPIVGWTPKLTIDDSKMGENGYIVRYVHNDDGLRNKIQFDHGKSNKTRIILVGDSFIYGFGVGQNETLSYSLQEYLGEDYEVLNMGVVGYSALQAFLYLKFEGILYEPDIVIFGHYYNDIIDNVEPNLRPSFNLKRGRLAFENYSYNEGDFVIDMSADKKELVQSFQFDLRLFSLIKPFFPNKQGCDGVFESPLYLYREVEDEEMSLMVDLNCWVLKQFYDLSSQADFEFYVMYIPNKMEIYDDVYRDTLTGCKQGTITDIDMVQKYLGNCASEYDINYVNLVQLYRENKDSALYNKYGHHWSPIAIELSAKHAVEKLKEDGVI